VAFIFTVPLPWALFTQIPGDIDLLIVVRFSLSVEKRLEIAKELVTLDGCPCPMEMSAITVQAAKS